jgi:hypothetical protein
MNTLVVTNPFGGHAKGERIIDPQEIDSILSGEHAHHVVRAVHADAPSITPGETPVNEAAAEQEE